MNHHRRPLPAAAAAAAAAAVIAALLSSKVEAQTPKSPVSNSSGSGGGEIVIAMRYLLPTGTSHAHLYLFREDGKMLRQLTNDNTGQDHSPIFAPDGETIVWARTVEKKPPQKNETQWWSIRPRGSGLQRLNAAPAWYGAKQSVSPFFTNFETDPPVASTRPAAGDAAAPVFIAPDGFVEIVLRERAGDPDDTNFDGPGHGKHYLLRDRKAGTETEMGKLPGFVGLYELLYETRDHHRNFVFDGPLKVAFFGLHLDSAAGDTVFALDLNPQRQRRLVRLSPNWAAPFPLPGAAAFLTLTENRYVPFSPDGKSANSSYVEHWDAALHRIRYTPTGLRGDAAARCYGASLYRSGQTPRIVTIISEEL